MTALLPAIPIVDARAAGAARFTPERRAQARALRDECLAFFPRGTAAALPLLDALARAWLRRSRSPYVGEIAAAAAALDLSGIWFLNGSYQWGCTALAREEDGVPWLARTLDWPFPGLGRHVEIAHRQGGAGDYFDVGWPGYAGTLSAMAPGRFAACLNQAPMLRRTARPWLRGLDLALNAANTWTRVRHMPPDHLLRLAFETCGSFAEARALLERTPVARPAIFVLCGCRPRERCVIERTEEGAAIHEGETAAANDWCAPRAGWEARMAARHFFKQSSAAASENSRARRTALAEWDGALAQDGFGWLAPPVLNPYTRLALVFCPAQGLLRAAGFEPAAGEDLPQAATQVRMLAAPPADAPAGRNVRSAATSVP
jgi:hypothetical protein